MRYTGPMIRTMLKYKALLGSIVKIVFISGLIAGVIQAILFLVMFPFRLLGHDDEEED